MTANTWPDPARPGVPLNPERDGWHWVRRIENNRPFPLEWTNDWTGSRDYCWAIMGSGEPEDVAKNICYLGPCLPLDEATALQKRVAELEAALKDAAASVKEWGAYASQYLQDKWDLSGEVARYIAISEGKNAATLGGKDE